MKALKPADIAMIGLGLLYAYSMCVAPLISGSGRWSYMQEVWDRWQGLNVGVLAFASTIMVYKITQYRANQERRQDFLASKALLPSALSDLCKYLENVSTNIQSAWFRPLNGTSEEIRARIPEEFYEIVKDCIKYANVKDGKYLSRMLSHLQVQNSRFESWWATIEGDHIKPSGKISSFMIMYDAAELQAFANRLFGFARGSSDLSDTKFTFEEISNGYLNLKIMYDSFEVDHVHNLENYTRNRVGGKQGV